MKWKNAKKSRDTAPLSEVASFFSKNFCWAKSRFTFPVCRRYSWTHYSRFLLKERGAEGWQHFNAILYWCPVRNNVNSERKCKLIFFFFPLFSYRRLIYSGPRIRQLICFANLGEFSNIFSIEVTHCCSGNAWIPSALFGITLNQTFLKKYNVSPPKCPWLITELFVIIYELFVFVIYHTPFCYCIV